MQKYWPQFFVEKSIRAKHCHYLDRQRSLGSKKAKFTQATSDSLNIGVRDSDSQDVNTPHNMYIDDNVYAEVYRRKRIE